jgi:hypothetical protein
MTDNNSSTSELDEAKKEPETKRTEYLENVKSFISNTLSSAFKLLIWCIFSLIIIYICKLAQSNILPTDINCYPYTNEKGHDPEKIDIPIFTNMFFRKPRKAMILEFPDSKNDFIDYILKSFKEYKINPKSSFLGNFFVSIIEPLIASNIGYYNSMFSFLNQIPEFLLVIFGPYLGLFILAIGAFYNMFSFTYHWVSNLGWMFKKNINVVVNETNGNIKPVGPPEWESVRWGNLPDKDNPDGKIGTSEWGSYLLAIFLIFIFIMILVNSIFFIVPIGSVVLAIFFIMTFLMYNIKLAGKKTSIVELFIYFFKYNKLIIMTIFSIYVISNANTYLGSTSAGFAVLTLFCIYYFKIIEMFVPVKSDLDERIELEVNSSQAYKVPCDPPKEKEQFVRDTNVKYASSMDRARLATSRKDEIKKDSSIPGIDTSISGTETSISGTETSIPGTDAAIPGTDAAIPGTDAAIPGTDAAIPGTETGKGTYTIPEKKLNWSESIQLAASNAKKAASESYNNTKKAASESYNNTKKAASDRYNNAKTSASSSFNNLTKKKGSSDIELQTLPGTTTEGPLSEVVAPKPSTESLNQKGGKKRKSIQIDSNNLVKVLKQFNKKYVQSLL